MIIEVLITGISPVLTQQVEVLLHLARQRWEGKESRAVKGGKMCPKMTLGQTAQKDVGKRMLTDKPLWD